MKCNAKTTVYNFRSSQSQHNMTWLLYFIFFKVLQFPEGQEQLERPDEPCQSQGQSNCSLGLSLWGAEYPPQFPLTSEDRWCSSEMCSMPYGGKHLSHYLSAVRDFVNPFTACSLDFRRWGSGMQGWLQQKWLQEFFSFQLEYVVPVIGTVWDLT